MAIIFRFCPGREIARVKKWKAENEYGWQGNSYRLHPNSKKPDTVMSVLKHGGMYYVGAKDLHVVDMNSGK